MSSHGRHRLIFLCLAVFLLLLPLATPRPGMPPTLKADEPAYYLMALSLFEDGDLVCDTGDLRRIFDSYPHLPVENLILMSGDGWKTAHFGKPYLYSLAAAPAVAWLGGRGMVAFNMVLFLAMVWMGFRYLRRWNDDGLAALFAGAFFLVSPAFAYVFWLQPEVFNMFGIAACLYLGLTEPQVRGVVAGWEKRSWWQLLTTGAARTAWSATALSLAVYNKPMFAVFGVPVLWALYRRRGLRAMATWVLAAVVSMAAFAGLSKALSDTPSAYLGKARAGLKIEDPEALDQILKPLEARSRRVLKRDEQPLASFGWLIRIPQLFPRLLKENLGYFFWGRHTGFLLYMPFAALAVLLFLLNGVRSTTRWLTAGAIAAVALFFIIWIHYNWHGGSGFVGNRYFAGAYPAFLFLVTTIRPAWTLIAGFVGGGLFLAPILLTPFGAPVPDPTLQFHTRSWAFERFPTELSLTAKIPGYETISAHGVSLRGRKDLVEAGRPGSGTLWLRGAFETELWATSSRPLETFAFEISTLAPDNRVSLVYGNHEQAAVFSAADFTAGSQLVIVETQKPTKIWYQYGKKLHSYRFLVHPETGRNPRRPDGQLVQPQFYLGAQLAFLGTREELTRKAHYRLGWGEAEGPPSPTPGQDFDFTVTLQNQSDETWPAVGARAVRLAYRWLNLDGEPVSDGVSSPLPKRLTSRSWTQVQLSTTAPGEEGAYILEIDAIREGLARFSERGTPPLRLDVYVSPPVVPNTPRP